MAHHSTEITTKCGRKVLFKKSSKSVTGFSGVLMFKDALKTRNRRLCRTSATQSTIGSRVIQFSMPTERVT